jgi:hypothetical protein
MQKILNCFYIESYYGLKYGTLSTLVVLAVGPEMSAPGHPPAPLYQPLQPVIDLPKP